MWYYIRKGRVLHRGRGEQKVDTCGQGEGVEGKCRQPIVCYINYHLLVFGIFELSSFIALE